MIFVESFPVGPFECNCVILADEETREAVIIDPGDDARRILDRAKRNGLNVRFLLHTHAHLDHIMATKRVKEETEAQVLLHPADDWLYQNLAMQCGMFGWNVDTPSSIDRHFQDGDSIAFGKQALRVIHTPGHTPGSVCLELGGEETPLILSGDTLFAGGIGRTDLWGGSYPQILRSIHEKLLVKPDPTKVIPGHGPKTTIGDERRHNPFLT
jgi:glyoxylase-like metal-dependent hydrolase (beta-lactamase superfamily II)